MIVTQWFSCKEKPKHEGWYECQFFMEEITVMRYWSGQGWYFNREKIGTYFGFNFGDKWRGLAVKL